MKNFLYLVVVLVFGTFFWSTISYMMFEITYLFAIKSAVLLTLFQFTCIIGMATTIQSILSNSSLISFFKGISDIAEINKPGGKTTIDTLNSLSTIHEINRLQNLDK